MAPYGPVPSFGGACGRKSYRLDLRQVELVRGVVDIESNDSALCIEIDVEPLDDLPRLGARRILQLDVETVRLRIVMQLHRSSSRKLRSKNALWIVSPSASVTTRRYRVCSSSASAIFHHKLRAGSAR